jgi:hypothetical protein
MRESWCDFRSGVRLCRHWRRQLMCVCMYHTVYVCTYVRTCIYIYIYICIHTQAVYTLSLPMLPSAESFVSAMTRRGEQRPTAPVFMCVCVFVCMYVRTYVCI